MTAKIKDFLGSNKFELSQTRYTVKSELRPITQEFCGARAVVTQE